METKNDARQQEVLLGAGIDTGTERDYAEAQHMAQRDAKQEAAIQIGRLLSAMNTKKIVEGVIAAVDGSGKAPSWTIFMGSVTITIPFQEAFVDPPAELVNDSTQKLQIRRVLFMNRCIGATVPFIVKSLAATPEGMYEATASRIDAMEIIRKRHFGRNASHKLEVGRDVDVRILSPSSFAAYVECCGLDVRVQNQALSHRYIERVSDDFGPGAMIRMRVMRLDESGDLPKVELSALPVELDQTRTNRYRLKLHPTNDRLNPLCGAVVTSIRTDTRSSRPFVVTRLWLEDYQLPAFSRDYNLSLLETLHSGDRVIFKANGFTEEGYVHGKITKVIRRR